MQTAIIRIAAAGLTLAVALAGQACNRSDGWRAGRSPAETAVVATIGPRTITVKDLDDTMKSYKLMLSLDDAEPVERMENLRKAVLSRIIDETVLILEADRLGVKASDEELEQELNRLVGDYDRAKLGLELARNELTFESWKEDVRKRLRIKKMELIAVEALIEVGEAEIKKYYEDHTDEFSWPERMRALQIMVADETTAEQIRKKLLSGGDFAKIAMEKSLSPDAAAGGDLGFFSRGQMPPEFEKAVFGLKVGQLSEVIESIYGFHLFKVVKREQPRLMSYPEARERIMNLLMDRKREKEYKRWLETLRERTPITVHLEVLQPVSS